jgi:hypothetical protein
MKKQGFNVWLNPFERIAGFQAFVWGFIGLIISTTLSFLSLWHYHGLLHFGAAPNPSWWCFVIEHLTIWLIPAILFYLGGALFSRSHIRFIDVFGTVLFAQLPLILMNLFAFLPPMQEMLQINLNTIPLEDVMKQPGFIASICLSLVSFIFLIWTLIWMFKALKVSCNLKGARLGIIYSVAIIGGDMICRLIISLCYK